MQCLGCQGEMTSLKVGELTVERCANCQGIWLDRGELDKFVEEEAQDAHWMEIDLWDEAKKMRGATSSRMCPHGHGPLVALKYGDSDIEVDVCPVGGGVWLDPGELEKILAYLEDKAVSLSLPDYIRESLQEARELIAGGDEGRIAEWRDLRSVLHLMRLRLGIEHPVVAAIIRSIPK